MYPVKSGIGWVISERNPTSLANNFSIPCYRSFMVEISTATFTQWDIFPTQPTNTTSNKTIESSSEKCGLQSILSLVVQETCHLNSVQHDNESYEHLSIRWGHLSRTAAISLWKIDSINYFNSSFKEYRIHSKLTRGRTLEYLSRNAIIQGNHVFDIRLIRSPEETRTFQQLSPSLGIVRIGICVIDPPRPSTLPALS